MRKSNYSILFFFLSFVMFLSIPHRSISEEGIFWEVSNRFAPFEVIKNNNGISIGIELFESWKFREGESSLDWHRRLWNNGQGILREGSPYAPHIIKNNTHWDEAEERHKSDYLKYIKNETSLDTTVTIHIGTTLKGDCVWSLKNSEFNLNIQSKCDEGIDIRVPLSGADVIVNNKRKILSDYISINHIVIVGFGGSYGSGEGNPDKPTEWRSDFAPPRNQISWLYDSNNYNKNGEAKWLDNDCHRSFFSHQTILALKIASEDKHSFVTFLHYACSGAEVLSGHLLPQYKPTNSNISNSYSQLNAAINDLCLVRTDKFVPFYNARAPQTNNIINYRNFISGTSEIYELSTMNSIEPIYYSMEGNRVTSCDKERMITPDIVFLEAGGNEISFANLVRFWVAPQHLKLKIARDLIIPDICPGEDYRFDTRSANSRCKNNSISIDRLIKGVNLDIRDENSGRIIDQIQFLYFQISHFLNIQEKNILHINYPDPIRNNPDNKHPLTLENGRKLRCSDILLSGDSCDSGNYTDCIPDIYGERSGYNHDSPWQALKSLRPWYIPYEYIAKWGFNVLKRESACMLLQVDELRSSLYTAAMLSGVSFVDQTSEAFLNNSLSQDYDINWKVSLPSHTSDWKIQDWHAYEFNPRGRAIRTGNDSYFTQSQGMRNNYYGTAHPNLIGHALIADMIFSDGQIMNIIYEK